VGDAPKLPYRVSISNPISKIMHPPQVILMWLYFPGFLGEMKHLRRPKKKTNLFSYLWVTPLAIGVM